MNRGTSQKIAIVTLGILTILLIGISIVIAVRLGGTQAPPDTGAADTCAGSGGTCVQSESFCQFNFNNGQSLGILDCTDGQICCIGSSGGGATTTTTTTTTGGGGECSSNCHVQSVSECNAGTCGAGQRRTGINVCDGNGDGSSTNCSDTCVADTACGGGTTTTTGSSTGGTTGTTVQACVAKGGLCSSFADCSNVTGAPRVPDPAGLQGCSAANGAKACCILPTSSSSSSIVSSVTSSAAAAEAPLPDTAIFSDNLDRILGGFIFLLIGIIALRFKAIDQLLLSWNRIRLGYDSRYSPRQYKRRSIKKSRDEFESRFVDED